MEQALDPLCLLFVDVDPQSLLKIVGGSFSPVLIENEWQPFLVKIRNRSIRDVHVTVRAKGQVDNKWIKVKPGSEDRTLIAPGEIEVEYRLVLLQSSEVGKREASLTVLVGDGQGDASSWSTADVAFQTLPSTLEGAEGSVTLDDGLHVRIVDRVFFGSTPRVNSMAQQSPAQPLVIFYCAIKIRISTTVGTAP